MAAKSVLIIDNGWYTELAVKMAEAYPIVMYWTPWQKDFPNSKDLTPGSGIDGVIRLEDVWDGIRTADFVVFPDLYQPGLQQHLREIGKPVWGGGFNEDLELDRALLKRWNINHFLPNIPYEIVFGVDSLEAKMRARDHMWIKLERGYRGDMETFHHKSWFLSEPWFRGVKQKLGANGQYTDFIVEPEMDGLEVGTDTFLVNGVIPARRMYGYEIKDAGYVGVVTSRVPSKLAAVDNALRNTMSGYRNLYSTELRILDEDSDKWVLIDLTTRFPSPPYGAELENIKNLPTIIEEGANGRYIPPVYEEPYVAELILESDWNADNWQAVKIEEGIRDRVKLHNFAQTGNIYHIPPNPVGIIGSVVGLGPTKEIAIQEALTVAEQVSGFGVQYNKSAMDEAMETVEKGEQHGIYFD